MAVEPSIGSLTISPVLKAAQATEHLLSDDLRAYGDLSVVAVGLPPGLGNDLDRSYPCRLGLVTPLAFE
jgi:hypothetical protein